MRRPEPHRRRGGVTRGDGVGSSVKGYETMLEIEFFAVARLAALEFVRADGGGPGDCSLPEAKIERWMSAKDGGKQRLLDLHF